MTTLFAGPWVGEFGWELFCWQGYLRKIAPKFDRVIVASRPGHECLYEDFCDEFIGYQPSNGVTSGATCEGIRYNDLHKKYIDNYYAWKRLETHKSTSCRELQHTVFRKYDAVWIPPETYVIPYLPSPKFARILAIFKQQEFVKYGRNTGAGFDVLIHARNIKSTSIHKNKRNWSIEKWEQLVQQLHGFSIGSIGSKQGAAHIKGSTDLRGVSLQKLTDVMASSELIVGPSSGPMHLASLCGLPHLVWSNRSNFYRYNKHWNPHRTPCIFYDKEGWDPRPESINKLVHKALNKKVKLVS
jgi:ADP-heptose:LPS heptosyltransferase